MSTYEQDCIIASEMGAAVGASEAEDSDRVTDSEFVIEAFRCPICRENRADYLVINLMAEEIKCANCGARYDIDTDDMFPDKPVFDEDERDELTNTCIEGY